MFFSLLWLSLIEIARSGEGSDFASAHGELDMNSDANARESANLLGRLVEWIKLGCPLSCRLFAFVFRCVVDGF